MPRPIRRMAPSGIAAWLALMVGPGCGQGDDSGRLGAGTVARAYGAGGASVRIFFAEKVEQTPSGTGVKVLADSERGEADPRRKVVVAVQDGAFRGMAGQMERGDLRAD